MKEVIKRYEDTKLFVSNYGKAFKLMDGYIEEADMIRNGEKLAIGIGGKQRINIDSLVWRTFVGETGGRKKLHVKHLDGNLDNNRLDNLEVPYVRRIREPKDRMDELQERIDFLEEQLKKALGGNE